MKQLFLTDLDGTLLTSEKKVSPATYQALVNFTNEGNIFAICTGRATSNAREIQQLHKLTFPNSYVIGYNGAEIYDYSNNEVILRFGVDKELACELLQISESYGIHAHTYQDDYLITKNYGEGIAYYRSFIPSPTIVTNDPLRELKKDPGKVIAVELHDRPRIEALRDELTDRFGDRMTFLFSNDCYLEMFSRDAGKGKALLALADHLHIASDNTIASGDQENDISMIQAAGLGIAMKNATDAVKRIADVITAQDNDHDGLAAVLAERTKKGENL